MSIGLVSGREMVRLARALPTNIAMRMALIGRHERMSAQRAYELGLVSEVVEHDRLLERAREIAALVNRNAPLAVRGTRLAIREGLDLPMHEAEVMAEAFRERVVRTDDAKEGPQAFIEKREPDGGAGDHRRVRDDPLRDVDDHVATITLEPARGAQRLRPRDVRGDARRVAAGQGRPVGPRRGAAGRRRPGVLRRPRHEASPTASPTTCGTTRTPASCSARSGSRCWKPVVCAVQGICTAGAFYFVNEADIVICSDDATFFDSHVTYGLVSALEPVGLMRKVGLAETLRIALSGNDERVTAETALRISLVTEVVDPRRALGAGPRDRGGHRRASRASATQGTVRAIWESLDRPYRAAMQQGLIYTRLGNPIGTAEVAEKGADRPKPRLR